MKRLKKQWIWIALGLSALLIRFLLRHHPEWIEQYYSRGLFVGIRWMIDYPIASWMPVPTVYVFLGTLVFVLARNMRKARKLPNSWPQRLRRWPLQILAFFSGAVFLFLFLWGYNYGRLPIEQQLGIKPEPLTLAELRTELEKEAAVLAEIRTSIPGISDSALLAKDLPVRLENTLRAGLSQWLMSNGFPAPGRVRVRKLLPRGIFLRFSSTGLYFPFSGEGNVDAGAHPLQLPHVMTHEMAHAYGFGDEGTCNFLAYLACTSSSDPFIAYAGHLDFYRTLAVNYLPYDPEGYQAFRAQLPAGIRADLDAINQTLQKYPDIVPRLRYHAYDAYLKMQGIQEGIQNYSRVIMLVKAWRARRES